MKKNMHKKRTGAVVRLVIWSLVAIGLAAVLTVGLLVDSFRWNGIINLGGYKGLDSAKAQEGNGTVSDQIYRLSIDWVDGSVTVLPTDEEKLTIREASVNGGEIEESHRMRWLVENGTLRIGYCKPTWWLRGKGKELIVQIPTAWLTDMETMKVNSVSGEVSLQDINGESSIEVTTVSGHVTANDLQAWGVAVETTSGNVTVNGTVNWADLDSVSGEIRLNGSTRNVDVETVSGEIDLYLQDTPKDVQIDTVSGDTNLSLPKDIKGFRVEMDSASGDLTVDFEGTWQSKTFRHGNGSAMIEIDSVSGDARILKGS